MSHPRAVFPARAVTEYQSGAGLKAMSAEYRCNAITLRRWLTDQGVQIRGQGKKGKA
jgi:hypothetical protein